MSVLVGREAPDFLATAVMPDGSINEAIKLSDFTGRYVVIFFWPEDFSFVCPTEIIAHHDRLARFRALNVDLIGVSVDSTATHLAWRNTPVDEGGVGALDFPIIADVDHGLCRSYGIEHPDLAVAMRATFLIDRQGIVQHQMVNNLSLGRNVDEVIRLIEALQFHEREGQLCPAGWRKGEAGIVATMEGLAEYLAKSGDPNAASSGGGRIVQLGDTNTDAAVAEGVALLYFWTPTCGTCREFSPVIEKVAARLGSDVLVGKINLDESPAVRKRYEAHFVPLVKVLKDGHPVEQFIGAKDEMSLLTAVQRALDDGPG